MNAATFSVNTADALAAALRHGMGAGLLPFYTALSGLRSGELVRILPEHTSQSLGVYAIYPSHKHADAKFRLWLEMPREKLTPALLRDLSELHWLSLERDVAPAGADHAWRLDNAKDVTAAV